MTKRKKPTKKTTAKKEKTVQIMHIFKNLVAPKEMATIFHTALLALGHTTEITAILGKDDGWRVLEISKNKTKGVDFYGCSPEVPILQPCQYCRQRIVQMGERCTHCGQERPIQAAVVPVKPRKIWPGK